MRREFAKVQHLFEQLDKAPPHKFPGPGERLEAPTAQGVYAIVSRRGLRVLHVGRTVSGKGGLWQRLSNHAQGKSSFVTLNEGGSWARVRAEYRFKYVEVEDPRIRAYLEAYAIGCYCPKHIGYSRSVVEGKGKARRNAA